MIKFFRIFVLFSVLFSLSGCLWGNGEGYGRKPGDEAPLPPNDQQGPSNEGTFYEMDPSFRCPPLENKAPGYRRAIEIRTGGDIFLSDACSDQKSQLSVSQLEFSLSREYLGFQDGIFEKRSSPPQPGNLDEIYAEVFCTSSISSNTSYAEVIVKNSRLSNYPLASLKIWIGEWILENQPAQKSENGNHRIYETGGFSLRINLVPQQNDSYKFSGTLSANTHHEELTLDMLCRVLQ